jgi:hypothetical protein
MLDSKSSESMKLLDSEIIGMNRCSEFLAQEEVAILTSRARGQEQVDWTIQAGGT